MYHTTERYLPIPRYSRPDERSTGRSKALGAKWPRSPIRRRAGCLQTVCREPLSPSHFVSVVHQLSSSSHPFTVVHFYANLHCCRQDVKKWTCDFRTASEYLCLKPTFAGSPDVRARTAGLRRVGQDSSYFNLVQSWTLNEAVS